MTSTAHALDASRIFLVRFRAQFIHYSRIAHDSLAPNIQNQACAQFGQRAAILFFPTALWRVKNMLVSASHKAPLQKSVEIKVEQEETMELPDSDMAPSLLPFISQYQHAKQKRQQGRPSKKDIPAYNWSNEACRKLARFVKTNPELFEKKHMLNVRAKTLLWFRAGKQLSPSATGLQCKKQYENMRTRVGKILKREQETGTSPHDRSAREQEIMNTWSFLATHMKRGKPYFTSDPVTVSPFIILILILCGSHATSWINFDPCVINFLSSTPMNLLHKINRIC